MAGTSQHVHLMVFTTIVLSLATHAASYSLTPEQCKGVVSTIGKSTNREISINPVVKGTWVSPRCEVRQLQDPDAANSEKTIFLLRMFDVQHRRKWSGHYFFYQDKDCREPTHGLALDGHVTTKGQYITFNISNVKIATYRQDMDRTLRKIYNQSCPGNMKIAQSKTATYVVYDVDKSVISHSECTKALGIGREEFGNAFIQSDLIRKEKTEGLKLRSVNLRKRTTGSSSDGAPMSYQWALSRHNVPMCMTCTKVSMGSLKHPPKLLARNTSRVDGAWGSMRCNREARQMYTSRFDKFAGNTFESSVFVSNSPVCDLRTMEFRTLGTIQLVSASVKVPGGVVYKMTVKQAYLTIYTDMLPSILNKGNCGKKDWAKVKTQDIMISKGCDVIGIQLGAPELVLLRTVRVEGRNELYLGIDPAGRKSGPVNYNVLSQDCTKFPVAPVTTTPPPRVPGDPLTWFPTHNTPLTINAINTASAPRTIVPSGRSPPSAPKSLLCFILCMMAVKFV